MKRVTSLLMLLALVLALPLWAVAAEPDKAPLADGVYIAKFETDSSMFRVNETKGGRGLLRVQDGQMTLHIILTSKNILSLYMGSAAQAQQDEEQWLLPNPEKVRYPDGLVETVHGFDIPVPCLDAEFDCALVGKKGTWYDHKVSVTEVQPAQTAEAALSGGSGRAKVESPCILEQDAGGQYWAILVWSSKNYEFMLVDGEQYEPLPGYETAAFRIPVELNTDIAVSAQTVAMSEPHLVDYTLHLTVTDAERAA